MAAIEPKRDPEGRTLSEARREDDLRRVTLESRFRRVMLFLWKADEWVPKIAVGVFIGWMVLGLLMVLVFPLAGRPDLRWGMAPLWKAVMGWLLLGTILISLGWGFVSTYAQKALRAWGKRLAVAEWVFAEPRDPWKRLRGS